jgi:hypothetical protein
LEDQDSGRRIMLSLTIERLGNGEVGNYWWLCPVAAVFFLSDLSSEGEQGGGP